jgi:hypothetical protein
VWRRRTEALVGWVRAGRRDDLHGWRAALGPLLRLVVLGALAYALYALLRALPWLLWLLTAWWLRAAWKAAAQAPTEAPAEAAPVPDREAVVALLLEAMGDAPAVHLRTVLAHLQQKGHWEGRSVSDLRANLERLGIPVHPKVKAPGGGPTRGVRRVDLAPSPVVGQEPSTEASTAA